MRVALLYSQLESLVYQSRVTSLGAKVSTGWIDTLRNQERCYLFTEEENGKVNIPSEIWQKKLDMGLSLLGKVVTRKWANFEALRLALHRMLNPGKGMRVQSLNEEHFLITFNHVIDLTDHWQTTLGFSTNS
ncbi:hypothetical protein Salat_1551100 [Sesamum alatum]|uniref:DUF4283 domain-containing protein n=1 Tax=Sesamum alatum TaxID=300844 RepID=A0AAE2CMN3_9LAMI|nr:hypothetical protein Salat_1551100 [Sesamum alatum]